MSFKLIRQPDAMDCGPACLAMIAKYYGKDYTISNLRGLMHTGKTGVSLLSISRAAENLGFRSIGGLVPLEMFEKQVPLPCVLHWNQNHFVVLYEIKRCKTASEFLVADPAKGLVTYSMEELCNHWLSTENDGESRGIVLTLEPTHLFFPMKTMFILSRID